MEGIERHELLEILENMNTHFFTVDKNGDWWICNVSIDSLFERLNIVGDDDKPIKSKNFGRVEVINIIRKEFKHFKN